MKFKALQDAQQVQMPKAVLLLPWNFCLTAANFTNADCPDLTPLPSPPRPTLLPACRITTANNRMFAAAAAAPAGEAEAMEGLQLSPVVPDAADKAGALLHVAGQGPVDPGATFTAAEQVAAGIMMGGAGSSAPANAGQAAEMASGQSETGAAAMQVD
jgi:hypothetical protein